MNYFTSCKTVEDIKSLYRKLAFQYHPDRGGDTATMQTINAQYTEALKRCNGQTTHNSDGTKHTYTYNAEREQSVIDFIDRLIAAHIITPALDAFLIGCWVWVKGDTKPIKDTLKTLGMQWHSKRLAWYWRPEDKKTHHYNSRADFNGLAAKYGASTISQPQSEALA